MLFKSLILAFVLITTCGISQGQSAITPDPVVLAAARSAVYDIATRCDLILQFSQLESLKPQSNDAYSLATDALNELGFVGSERMVSRSEVLTVTETFLLARNAKEVSVGRIEKGHIFLRDYPRVEAQFDEDLSEHWPRKIFVLSSWKPILKGSAHLTPDKNVYDFGVIEGKAPVVKNVTLTNTGSTAMTFVGVRTSCSCTTVAGDLSPLDPGARREFVVTFKPTGRSGLQEQLCIFQTADGNALFKICGFVNPRQVFYPQSLNFGILSLDQPADDQISFLSRVDRPIFPIISVEPDPHLSLDITHGQNLVWHLPEDTLHITIKRDIRTVGKYESNLTVHYWEGTQERVATIPISAEFVKDREILKLLILKADADGQFSGRISLPRLKSIKLSGDYTALYKISIVPGQADAGTTIDVTSLRGSAAESNSDGKNDIMLKCEDDTGLCQYRLAVLRKH